MDALKALGTGNTVYQYSSPNISILEKFDNPIIRTDLPKTRSYGIIDIVAPEFTSLCPITSQPDFATIRIQYAPDLFCVESKSLKLYLGAFRQEGMFHEACVNRIAEDLWSLLDPLYLEVVGEFSPRGGIKFWPKITKTR